MSLTMLKVLCGRQESSFLRKAIVRDAPASGYRRGMVYFQRGKDEKKALSSTNLVQEMY